jgi:glutamate-1-semialdehyde aminotransferase
MHWMRKWPGGFPVFVQEASGARRRRTGRGILLTPFHNMALMSPATTVADVDLHTDVFREAALELAAR